MYICTEVFFYQLSFLLDSTILLLYIWSYPMYLNLLYKLEKTEASIL